MRPSPDPRLRWGLAGLLGFEALLLAYTFARGAMDFAFMAALAGALLAYALVQARERAPSALAWGALALVTLVRAVWQTRAPGFPPGVLPTYLVPMGFAIVAIAAARSTPRLARPGVVLVALARTWFVGWYFLLGATPLAFANLVAAAGAWVWASAATAPVAPEESASAS